VPATAVLGAPPLGKHSLDVIGLRRVAS